MMMRVVMLSGRPMMMPLVVLVMLVQCLMLMMVVVPGGANRQEKSIVQYLGSSLVMLDGCPMPDCDVTTEECKKLQNMIRNLYSHCVQSQEGQHLGCVTDQLANGRHITLPVYASVCSAMCYESEHIDKIKKCPHPGVRQHNPIFSNVF